MAIAAAPAADTHFREGREGLSGDVTVMSKTAGLPQSQQEARMSAGCACWSSHPCLLPASALGMHDGRFGSLHPELVVPGYIL